jgi:hypothetical protein
MTSPYPFSRIVRQDIDFRIDLRDNEFVITAAGIEGSSAPIHATRNRAGE